MSTATTLVHPTRLAQARLGTLLDHTHIHTSSLFGATGISTLDKPRSLEQDDRTSREDQTEGERATPVVGRREIGCGAAFLNLSVGGLELFFWQERACSLLRWQHSTTRDKAWWYTSSFCDEPKHCSLPLLEIIFGGHLALLLFILIFFLPCFYQLLL